MAKVVVKKAVRPAPHIAPERPKKSTDPTVRTYRAMKQMLVADDTEAQSHYRYFGDYVPEAATWKNFGVYLKNGDLELAYVNQSEIDAWRVEYDARCAKEDAEKKAQEEDEEALLLKRLAEIRKGKEEKKDFKENRDEFFKPGKARVQKIDFGAVGKPGSVPRPAELPQAATREVPQQKKVAANRNRPTTVRRKKV